MRRVMPPYARRIQQARRGDLTEWVGTSANGKNPSLWLCVGPDAWNAVRDWSGHRLITLLPPNQDPVTYDWTCLADADPLLLWRCGEVDGATVEALLKAVMRDGTDRVLDLSTGTRYVAEVRRVVA